MLDEAEDSLKRDGVSIPLTPKQFDLLVALVEHAGRLVEKNVLLRVDPRPDELHADPRFDRLVPGSATGQPLNG